MKTLVTFIVVIFVVFFTASCSSKEKYVDSFPSPVLASDEIIQKIINGETLNLGKDTCNYIADTSRVKNAHPLPIMMPDFSSSIGDDYILNGRKYVHTRTNTGFSPILLLLIIILCNSSNSSRRRN